uniref:Ribosome biogenesis protein NOP53 n=1 Tax=Daphnia similis TaxID=35528 RepID=A0A4Y7N367_9CRUS|nr:EOG090X07H9 [Daphnia similis]SVE86795.1 EOG090X07H9 [Daphnia similis]SVE87421.1 EOG090X07H9 [Daphnia similis]SVE88048.1 EOG090X07H9 [Daphnia similis]
MATSTLGAAWLVDESDKLNNKKQKRIVKHKKKAWRVTSNIEDVERFLESKRLDERLGAPLEERPSDSLFVVDTKTEADKPVKSEPTKKRKIKEIGPLRCYAILTPNSAVTDPLKKRNRVRLPEERGDPLLRKVMEERRAKGKIPTRFLQSMKHHQENVEALAKKKKPERLRTTFDFDLWGDAGDSLMIGDKKVSALDLSDQLKTYTMEKMGNRVYSRPPTMFKKTTGLKPIEYPHPGTSYNPTYQDHQALLKEAYNLETKEMKEEARTRRRLGPMLKKIPVQRKEEDWWSEMTQGLGDDEEPAKEEEEEVPCVRPTKPKTRKQKIRAKALKWQDMRRKKLKEAKKRLLELDRLRSIRREIRKSEELTAKRIEIRKKEKEAKMFKPAMLGRHKYEPPPIEVNLSEEITGTLRGLKTEGHVLIDRFKSMQRRNIIEPRVRQTVVFKYKHKVFTKRSHSEPKGLKVGNRNKDKTPVQ